MDAGINYYRASGDRKEKGANKKDMAISKSGPYSHIFFLDDFSCYSLKELCQNGEFQYKMNCKNIDRLLNLLPDDYIPVARVWPGYMTLATLFGIEVHWSDEPNLPPGIKNHIIHEITDIHQLKKPDPRNDGFMLFNLTSLRYYRENLPNDVYLTGIDLSGPLNSAKDLFGTNLLYTAFYDTPR